MAEPLKMNSPQKNEIASPSVRNDTGDGSVVERKPEADEAISNAVCLSRGKNPCEKYSPVVFSELFGNSNPVEFEIGCGKGKFLVARSIANPGTNFLGIDRVSKFMNIGKTRAHKRALPNIRFIRAEARAFLTEAIAPGSVSIFHIYFPDPWPKRRHRVRRVFTADLLRLLHARLVPEGLVEIATDDKDYFDAMKKTIAATAQLWENTRETVNERILDSMNKTSYEIKWAAEGRSLYYTELKKR